MSAVDEGADGARRAAATRKSGLLRRLPVILVVALGVFLWRAPYFAQERTLVWQLPSRVRPAQSVDLQLYDADGDLLKREESYFKSGTPDAISWKFPLKKGRYRAQLYARLPPPAPPVEWSSDVEVGSEETLVLPVR